MAPPPGSSKRDLERPSVGDTAPPDSLPLFPVLPENFVIHPFKCPSPISEALKNEHIL